MRLVMIVLSTFKFQFFFIEVQLIYNSIEILGVQHNYSQLLKVLNHLVIIIILNYVQLYFSCCTSL